MQYTYVHGNDDKLFESFSSFNDLTLGPSLRDSITKVWPEIERLSDILAVTPFRTKFSLKLIQIWCIIRQQFFNLVRYFNMFTLFRYADESGRSTLPHNDVCKLTPDPFKFVRARV